MAAESRVSGAWLLACAWEWLGPAMTLQFCWKGLGNIVSLGCLFLLLLPLAQGMWFMKNSWPECRERGLICGQPALSYNCCFMFGCFFPSWSCCITSTSSPNPPSIRFFQIRGHISLNLKILYSTLSSPNKASQGSLQCYLKHFYPQTIYKLKSRIAALLTWLIVK